MDKKELLSNINQIHTTELGINRIRKNLKLNTENPVEYCKEIIQNQQTLIYKQGKNYYCTLNNIKLTINSYSYTIITAHIVK